MWKPSKSTFAKDAHGEALGYRTTRIPDQTLLLQQWPQPAPSSGHGGHLDPSDPKGAAQSKLGVSSSCFGVTLGCLLTGN